MRFSVFVLWAATAFAADRDFNGRWDLTVPGEPKGRAWWLEVVGAGTPDLKGRFVGFTGGDMNDIPKLSLRNGELQFSSPKEADGSYTVRLQGKKLIGSNVRPNGKKFEFTGVRTAVIKEKDDGSWNEGKPIDLFDQKSLEGWKAADGWSVKNGVLTSTGGAKNLATAQQFWNFKLHVEYRVGPHSNSGVGLRGRYEVQILDDAGEAPNRHMNGALYSRIQPPANVSKGVGEWQSLDVRLVGRDVTVVLNDHKIIEKQVIEGLTAIATDPNEGEPGPIVLQGDHGPVEFRKLVLTPLTR